LFAILVERNPTGDPAAVAEFLHDGFDGRVHLDFPVDQLGLVAVHLLKYGEQKVFAQFDGCLQHHVKHLAVMLLVVFVLCQGFDVEHFVQQEFYVSLAYKLGCHSYLP